MVLNNDEWIYKQKYLKQKEKIISPSILLIDLYRTTYL